MKDRLFVRPRDLTKQEQEQYPGLEVARVRKQVKEGGGILAAEGEFVKEDSYWLRLLKVGDVAKAKKASPKPATPPLADEPKSQKPPKAAKPAKEQTQ